MFWFIGIKLINGLIKFGLFRSFNIIKPKLMVCSEFGIEMVMLLFISRLYQFCKFTIISNEKRYKFHYVWDQEKQLSLISALTRQNKYQQHTIYWDKHVFLNQTKCSWFATETADQFHTIFICRREMRIITMSEKYQYIVTF